MSIFKCKMCGGTLEFAENEKVGVCDSCGTKQTLPSFSDDAILYLFNRANTLRQKAEFDKAEEIYGKIIEKEPDNAEAHWGIILCKYGIEYVEDPKTYRRVPTCHRASFDAVTADSDYKAAIANADISGKALYEAEAAEIDRLQKDILAVAENEKPFDVFICYKETDANGSRTNDSVIANDIYHELTEEGYKVFYSAITLEDKLGVEYEPYIFAALNSAKVMLVIGTKPEYFTAVWVKNEWSRFLKIIKADRKKLLIPCYKDIDAYELPEEFAHFQAQDMSKIGFINDVVRGIKKVISKDEAEVKTAVETVSVNNAGSNVSALLKRGYMALEDEEWGKADGFFEDALNQDAENANAYFGKLMAELHVKKQEELKNLEQPFDNSKSYQKVLRFADPATAKTLKEYITNINERNENNRLTGIYNDAMNAMNAANAEDTFKTAAAKFSAIRGFKDAGELEKQCLRKAEACCKNAIYYKALAKTKERAPTSILEKKNLSEAIIDFSKIKGWKDADKLIAECKERLEGIAAKEKAECVEAARKAEERRIAAEKTAKRRKKVLAIGIPIVAACIVFVFILINVIIPNNKYKSAMSLLNVGDYDQAYDILNEIGRTDVVVSSKYNRALSLIDSHNYEEAIPLLAGMDYENAKSKLEECQFEMQKANLVGIKNGDIVRFGYYEQDNNISNGKEEIEWVVLDVEDKKVLLISKYALDGQQYNTSETDITWDKCTLRKWLQDVFLHSAFSEKHIELIPTVLVSADINPKCSTDPGKLTNEKIFLLSISEVEKYVQSDNIRQCSATAYAKHQGAYVDPMNGNCWWWLRSPGYSQRVATSVDSLHSINYYGNSVSSYNFAVRPALWINLDP